MKRKTPKSFNKWWSGLRSHSRAKRKDITDKWLYYATKTVSMRGNQDEQLVVFAIWNRYSKSQWDISKWSAKIVYDIVNQKQVAYKRQNPRKTVPVVIKKKTTRRVISSGHRNGYSINYNK